MSNLSSNTTSKKSKRPVSLVAPTAGSTILATSTKNVSSSPSSSFPPAAAAPPPPSSYSTRKSNKFNNIVTTDDSSKLITGTLTNNAVRPSDDDQSANYYSSLFGSQHKDISRIDLEANINHYGSISPNNINEENLITTITNSPCSYLQNLTNTQVWLLFGIVVSLVILTVFLFLLGDTSQLQIIWNKIFCWLGIMNCGSN